MEQTGHRHHRWLEALNEPTSASAARAAAAPPLFGWTVSELLRLQEPDGPHEAWDEWCGYIKTWRHQFERNGFYRVIQKALARFDVLENLLKGPDGERQVTDLLHCIDLIHETQPNHRFPLAGLLRWLRDPARQEGSSDDELIRLERDDKSVRIMTMHKSKTGISHRLSAQCGIHLGVGEAQGSLDRSVVYRLFRSSYGPSH